MADGGQLVALLGKAGKHPTDESGLLAEDENATHIILKQIFAAKQMS